MRQPTKLASLWLLTGFAAAFAGVPFTPRPPDRVVDDFEGEKRWAAHAQGKTTFKVDPRTGICRWGSGSLLVRIDASQDTTPRHTLRLTWRLPQPEDWTGFEGVQLWLQELEGSVGLPWLLVHEASGATYRMKLNPRPGKSGEWQFLQAKPFSRFGWNFEGRNDPDNKLNLDQITGVTLHVFVAPGQSVTFALDQIGAYKTPPAYAGPKLAFRRATPGNIADPGQPMKADLLVRELPSGTPARVKVAARDFWGKTAYEKTSDLPANHPKEPKLAVSLEGLGYFDLSAQLEVAGKVVWEEPWALATIPPLPQADAELREDSIFGTWVGGLTLARKYGVKWYRTYCRPFYYEPAPGTGHYRLANGKPFRAPVRPGMYGIHYFAGMPKWLSSRPDRPDWRKWKPKRWEDYDRFLRWYIGKVKDHFTYYEVWNEPVPYAYWMGTIEDVVKLHEVTYKAIHAADPDAVVMGPCPYSFRFDFMEEFFELGGHKWVDRVVIHAYTKGDPDTGLLRENIHKVRAMARRYGLPDRIYITELGWNTAHVTESQQANYLVRSYVLAMAEAVRVLMWHMYWEYKPGTQGTHAIVRHNQTPMPAFVAYATLIRQLERAQYEGEVPGLRPTQRGFRFRKDGRQILVLWDHTEAGSTLRVALPGHASAAVCDIMGVRSTMPLAPDGSLTLRVGPSPVFVACPAAPR